MWQKDWESYIHHADNLQEENFMKEIGCDAILEPIINLQDSDDEDSDELLTDEDSDDDDSRNTNSEPLARCFLR